MKIKFHSEARKEFFEAAEYYEEQVTGLGDDFIDEVEKVLNVITQKQAAQASLATNNLSYEITTCFPDSFSRPRSHTGKCNRTRMQP